MTISKTKKGQAAMEYLMTYGWALLVIVIVLALLLIILGGYLQGTPSCTFQEAGFVCNEPVVPVMDTSGVLYGQFQHAQDEAIILKDIAFVEGQVSKDGVNCWANPSEKDVPPRTPMKFSDLADGNLIGCTAAGDELSPTAGSQVRGQLWIVYSYASDAAIGFGGNRTATATVIANVE